MWQKRERETKKWNFGAFAPLSRPARRPRPGEEPSPPTPILFFSRLASASEEASLLPPRDPTKETQTKTKLGPYLFQHSFSVFVYFGEL